MQPTHQEYAEFYRLGLKARVCGPIGIARWAYHVVLQRETRNTIVDELCYSGVRSPVRIDQLLRRYVAETPTELPVLMLLGHTHRVLLEGRVAPETLLMRLYCTASQPEFPDRIYHELSELEDAYILARDGTFRTVAEVGEKFAQFVSYYECYAPELI